MSASKYTAIVYSNAHIVNILRQESFRKMQTMVKDKKQNSERDNSSEELITQRERAKSNWQARFATNGAAIDNSGLRRPCSLLINLNRSGTKVRAGKSGKRKNIGSR